mgnify:CR=1 FL=1
MLRNALSLRPAIVAALLELAEHDQRDVEFQDLDLVPLIESALDDERSTIEASGIAVTIELPASAPVRGDAVLLRQAVVNVVHNSVRYNRPGGLIRICGHFGESTMTLTIENTGDDAFAFSAALHTYLRVDEIAAVAIEGLHGCDFEDSANGGTLHRQHDHDVRFDDETDRIYSDVVAPLALVEGERRLAIEQDGFADAIVWNPGQRLGARIGDLAADDWRRFACVEAGQVLQPVVLAPGESWRGRQLLG